MTDSEREYVLRMIEDGKISAEEGLRLMQALEAAPLDEDAAPEPIVETPMPSPASADATQREFQAHINKLRRLWLVPLLLGLVTIILCAWWMFQNVQTGLNGWFIFPLFCFLAGVGLIALGAGSRTARWLYLDLKEPRGADFRRIHFAFPIPTGLIRWGIQTFGHSMSARQRSMADQVLEAIFESDVPNEPLVLDVKEEDGQHVRLYIG